VNAWLGAEWESESGYGGRILHSYITTVKREGALALLPQSRPHPLHSTSLADNKLTRVGFIIRVLDIECRESTAMARTSPFCPNRKSGCYEIG
jgi:hypothetical protein